jgi:hypothetical protein
MRDRGIGGVMEQGISGGKRHSPFGVVKTTADDSGLPIKQGIFRISTDIFK